MQTPYRALAGLWRSLVWTIQANRTVEALSWRLPHESRRSIVRICGVDTGVSQTLASEILAQKTLFIRVPKTAGMSVQQALFGAQIFAHQTFRQYELIFIKELLASFYTFTFVRNPWDRLVSAWTYLRENAMGHTTVDPWGGRWFANHLAQYADFETFVLRWVSRKTVEKSYTHFRPQTQFLENARGQIEVNFIGRFKDLAEDFQKVAQAMGRAAALEVRNRTRSRGSASYRESYNAKTAEIVAKAYEDDVQAFGYEF